MYGTCLTIYEPFELKLELAEQEEQRQSDVEEASSSASERKEQEEKVFLPKVLCILSSWPYLTAFREFLTQLHRISRSGNMQIPLERFVINFCAEIPAPPPGTFSYLYSINWNR